MTPVEVPKVGNTVEECIVGEWRKHKGDQVTAGEVIAEIETDKTTFEITAPVSGTILEVFVTQGRSCPCSPSCASSANREKASTPQSGSGRRWLAASTGVAAAVAVSATAPVAVPTALPESAHLSPRARRFAAEHNFVPNSRRFGSRRQGAGGRRPTGLPATPSAGTCFERSGANRAAHAGVTVHHRAVHDACVSRRRRAAVSPRPMQSFAGTEGHYDRRHGPLLRGPRHW